MVRTGEVASYSISAKSGELSPLITGASFTSVTVTSTMIVVLRPPGVPDPYNHVVRVVGVVVDRHLKVGRRS